MGFFGKKKINYSFLRYQKSLANDAQSDALAVIVESDEGAIVIGRAPVSVEGVSQVGREVLAQLPEILRAQVAKLRPTDLEGGLILALASTNGWNLSFSKPIGMRSDDPIDEVALTLFFRHVMKGAQVLERATRTGRPQSRTERVELFELAAPIAAGV